MTKILFVDDEPNVLSGLRRMLHGMRHEWDMTFVGSGEVALTAIDNTFFDIIVSDLRMPGMDGATLLRRLREASPETVRIALSGYADKDATLRAITEAHQFLSKPCEPDTLKGVLGRAVALGNLLKNPRLKKIVSRMNTLPSVSSLYDDVVLLIENPDASANSVGAAISRDAGMSAKVLQLANSALFSVPQLVSDPVQATILLGLETIKLLILSVKLFDQFSRDDLPGVSISEIWGHSTLVARLAKRLALEEAVPEPTADHAFLAGLLHDIGKVVFACNMSDQYQAVLNLTADNPASVGPVERKVLGSTHGEVGAYLMGLWGFPEATIEAIGYHHTPGEDRFGDTGQSYLPPLAAVHVANAYANWMVSAREIPFVDCLDMPYLEHIGVAARVGEWQRLYRALIGP